MGKTLAESGLEARDIVVLTLHRGVQVISNPKGTQELAADDRLLCYGRLENMRDLAPERRQRRRAKLRKLPKDAGALPEGLEPVSDVVATDENR